VTAFNVSNLLTEKQRIVYKTGKNIRHGWTIPTTWRTISLPRSEPFSTSNCQFVYPARLFRSVACSGFCRAALSQWNTTARRVTLLAARSTVERWKVVMQARYCIRRWRRLTNHAVVTTRRCHGHMSSTCCSRGGLVSKSIVWPNGDQCAASGSHRHTMGCRAADIILSTIVNAAIYLFIIDVVHIVRMFKCNYYFVDVLYFMSFCTCYPISVNKIFS